MTDPTVTCETCGARRSCISVSGIPRLPRNVELTMKRRCNRPLVDGLKQCSFQYRAGVDVEGIRRQLRDLAEKR